MAKEERLMGNFIRVAGPYNTMQEAQDECINRGAISHTYAAVINNDDSISWWVERTKNTDIRPQCNLERSSQLMFGMTWEQIQRKQQGK